MTGVKYRVVQIVHPQVFNGITVRAGESREWIYDTARECDDATSMLRSNRDYRLTITPWDGTGPALDWSRYDDRQGIYSYEIRPIFAEELAVVS